MAKRQKKRKCGGRKNPPIRRVYNYNLSPVDFSKIRLRKGERVRIYVYTSVCQDVQVREGVVLDPSTTKQNYWFRSFGKGRAPALLLEVHRRGIARFERTDEVKPYKTRFMHMNIGLVERL